MVTIQSRPPLQPGERAPDFMLPTVPEDPAVMDQFPPRDFHIIHAGHFLIDRAGVVRWEQIETPIDDLSRWGRFPTDEELLAAVEGLPTARP